jgi:hypothetical protein
MYKERGREGQIKMGNESERERKFIYKKTFR